jgi:hypothetical protein
MGTYLPSSVVMGQTGQAAVVSARKDKAPVPIWSPARRRFKSDLSS